MNLRFSVFCFLHFCSFGGLRFFNYCSSFIQLCNIAKVLALYKSYWVAMVCMYRKNLNTRMAMRIHDDVFSCLLNSDFSSLGPRLYGPAKSRKVGQKGYLSSLVNLSERLYRASDISRKKKQNFAGFSGANSRKNRPISREKSKNSRKNRPISREKSQNSPENRSISRDFSGKNSNFEGFSGANS